MVWATPRFGTRVATTNCTLSPWGRIPSGDKLKSSAPSYHLDIHLTEVHMEGLEGSFGILPCTESFMNPLLLTAFEVNYRCSINGMRH